MVNVGAFDSESGSLDKCTSEPSAVIEADGRREELELACSFSYCPVICECQVKENPDRKKKTKTKQKKNKQETVTVTVTELLLEIKRIFLQLSFWFFTQQTDMLNQKENNFKL